MKTFPHLSDPIVRRKQIVKTKNTFYRIMIRHILHSAVNLLLDVIVGQDKLWNGFTDPKVRRKQIVKTKVVQDTFYRIFIVFLSYLYRIFIVS